MRVFNVWASSSPYATFVPNFVSFAAPLAELARGEKSRTRSITQSLTHSPSLFDASGTEAFAPELYKVITSANEVIIIILLRFIFLLAILLENCGLLFIKCVEVRAWTRDNRLDCECDL